MTGGEPERPPAAPAVRTLARPRLRVLGTEISLLEDLRLRAQADLGIDIAFESRNFVTAQHQAAAEPGSYDVYDQCFHNLDIVWYWRAIQPIDRTRITLWDEVTDLTKTGRIDPGARIGFGDAPVTKLFVQPNRALGPAPSRWLSMLPTTHNFDAFAFRPDLLGDAAGPIDSWGALLDGRWHGRAALVDEPAIGVFDAALAVQSLGLMSFEDIGNMSTEEIDTLLGILIERRKSGYFAGFWKTAAEAADMMCAGSVAIQSMWSPGLTTLRHCGVAVTEAVPREGYRAWHGGLCLSSGLTGRMLDVAYDYLNWWLSGWPGAVMARQGYYMSIPGRVRAHLTPDEWNYWYEGLPTRTDLPGPDGAITIRAGSVRDGGSYRQRANSIAVWNTTMDEHNYLVRRWAQLVG
ncbi:ABC transporter substrate-binding protein [Labrys wisconsinensis]|uniref:Spermidine/putrescine transport system substrate-binding protein n=1 Tax=Labrys wisconsinensis TaxID=425677 RepID=A0ABU0JGC0_9HYPH|nr:extracellular solute-binding protein [Labrys wisconsinensis]MDQ0472172.1 putative spermidine/putrescine transport system substrate-binding protein [Labrys wisconsinensis]